MLSLIRGISKIKQAGVYKKTEANSQIQRTNQWLPVGRGKGEGQDKGRGLRDTNYVV